MLTHSAKSDQLSDSPISVGVKNDDSQTPFCYLGNNTNLASESSLKADDNDVKKAKIVERFYLQSLARELLPDHRVNICGRFLAFDKDHVQIVYRKRKKIAAFQNLARCSSLWVCVPCAAIITERRRQELKTGVENWQNQGGKVLMFSYTLRHNQRMSLAGTLGHLDNAYRRFLAGEYGVNFREGYGVIGTVKASEVTHGVHGWHPHIHSLVFGNFTDHDVNVISHDLKMRWTRIAKAVGANASYDNGFDVKKDNHYLAQYISKYGHEPTKELWSLESELTKANTKKGKRAGRTPVQLLIDYGDGDAFAGRLFQEFAHTFHGKKQLIWTRGLKVRLGVDDMSDQDIINAEEQNSEYELLSILNGHEWRRVRERNLQASLLIVASDGDAKKLEQFLRSQYIREG